MVSFTSFAGLRARLLLREKLSQHTDLPPLHKIKDKFKEHRPTLPIKIGIVGAGMAGIYTAFILDKLAIHGLEYEILEGNDRVGGRVYTHNFSNEKHDYYEAGAMRFPKIPPMKRFFDFCDATETPLIPYYFEEGSKACPMLFNNIRMTKPVNWGTNPFNVQPEVLTFVHQNPGDILKASMQEYIDKLLNDPVEGLRDLMKMDNYSTAQFLMEKCGMSRLEVEYLEAFTASTNLFSRAFTEEVLEMVDFTSKDWSCVEDGISTLAFNAVKLLKKKPLLRKKITGIIPVPGGNTFPPHIPGGFTTEEGKISPPGPKPLLVKVEGEHLPRKYDAVVLTTTLGCARRIDMSLVPLNWGQKQAMRRLGYAAATKVGIKFTRPWWITDRGVTSGGFAVTDEPLRICVYPSYNLSDDPDKPSVLLCSYTWTQDAQRMGTLVHRDSPDNEAELLELLLRGLRRLHNISLADLKLMYVTHHAWDWYRDPFSTGAYASFEPAQWAELYTLLSRPAAYGRLIFAGEAASTHHAWILGALESGYRAVAQILILFGFHDEIRELVRLFGVTDEMDLEKYSELAFYQAWLGLKGADDENGFN